jgi:hypothetical protein
VRDDLVKEVIRIEIIGKDSFWERAFHVEWESQFPNRTLAPDQSGFLAHIDWIVDLERVGQQTLCSVVRAPENPRRRKWIGSLIPRRIN